MSSSADCALKEEDDELCASAIGRCDLVFTVQDVGRKDKHGASLASNTQTSVQASLSIRTPLQILAQSESD